MIIDKIHSQSNISFNQKQRIPDVEKPVIAYMKFLEKEPSKFDYDFSAGNILSNILKSCMSANSEEIKQRGNISKTEVKVETKVETKTNTKEKNIYTDYSYKPYKAPLVKRVLSTVSNILLYPVEKLLDLKYELNYFLYDLKQKRIERKEEIRQSQELKRMQKIMESNSLKNDFAEKLNKYKSMFEPNDTLPDMSEFENYDDLPPNSIKQLSDILDKRINHQGKIIDLKERYRKGAGHYANDDDHNNLKNCKLHTIRPDFNKKGKEYRKELKRLCMLYLQNAKIIEAPINSFDNVSKNFFRRAKENLEEIFALKKHWIFKSEMIPYIGIIPKSIRVIDQVNLTRCILQDFEDITESYVKNGIQPTMNKFGQQYDNIVRYAQNRKSTAKDEEYTKKLLSIIKNAKTKRIKTYATLYNKFIKGGLALQNTCKNIRLKDGISLAMKTAKLFVALG